MTDCIWMLRASKNVASVSDPVLAYPKAKGADVYDRLQEACLAGTASFNTSGGDPALAGFGRVLTPFTVAKQVRSIRLLEIYNYGPWGNPQLGCHGFGGSGTSTPMILLSAVTASIWEPTAAMLADAWGMTPDSVDEAHRFSRPRRPLRYCVRAHREGHCLGHVRRDQREGRRGVAHRHRTHHQVAAWDFPDHGLGEVYRVVIDGEPIIMVDIWQRSGLGDTTHAGFVLAVTPVSNAISAICEVPKGVLNYLDLRPRAVRGLLWPR